MNLVMRIWGTALIIQPLFFVFALGWNATAIIPFEIGGSLPAIFIFGVTLKALVHAKLSLAGKSILLALAAVALSTCASLAIVLLVGLDAPQSAKDLLLLLPAPLAALGALLLHYKSIRRFLNSETETAVEAA